MELLHIRRSTATGNALVLPSGTTSRTFVISGVPQQMRITRFIFACETTLSPPRTFSVTLYDRDVTQPGLSAGYITSCAVSPTYTATTAEPVVQTSCSLHFHNDKEHVLYGILYLTLTGPTGGFGAETQWALTIVGEAQSC